MTNRIEWSEDMDRHLLSLCRDGLPWHAVARALQVGRNSAIDRARQLGIPPARHPPPAPKPPTPERSDRAPYPPGHPLSWQAITAGTMLAAEPYPYPVFL